MLLFPSKWKGQAFHSHTYIKKKKKNLIKENYLAYNNTLNCEKAN